MKIILALTHGLHVRNWCATGLLKMLVDQGHRVTVLAPEPLLGWVIQGLMIGDPQGPYNRLGLCRTLAVEPYTGSRVRRWLRAGPYRTASYATRSIHTRTYAHKLARRRRWRQRLEIAVAGRLGEGWALESERRWRPGDACVRLLQSERPDLLVTPSFLHTGLEVDLLKAARVAGITTVVPVATWDALVSKGCFLERPDRLLVWGEQSKQHAYELHGFQAQQVVVTGAPQFDVYAGPMPAGQRQTVLVAGTTIAYWQDEQRVVEALARDGERAGYAVHYRPHPRQRRDLAAFAEGLGNVTLDGEWREQAANGGGFSPRPADLGHLRGVLDRCFGVVASFSTVSVEAALLGLPTFMVGFGVDIPGHADWEHISPILTWPGVALCETTDHLLAQIRMARSGAFESCVGGLRERANTVARNLDGLARERIVGALEEADG